MGKKELLAQLETLFRNVLDNESITLNESTSADDIEEWDSLAHVQLIDAIQFQYRIKFSAKEMLAWDNVGDMADCIISKMK